ncbi:Protein unc-45 -like protein B [Halotydeus destructor]|nr:Protein unc-45 -like protein B [Halotydeus destructor]
MVQAVEIIESKMSSASKLKEEGNKYFKDGYYNEAVSCYKNSIGSEDVSKEDKLAALKNLSAAYLKLEKFSDAVESSTSALEIDQADVKALFRRCQAYEGLERYGDAFQDALKVQHIDRDNSAIKPILRRLNERIQDLSKKQASTTNKVSQMFKYIQDPALDDDKRETAVNNLIVLAKDNAGAKMIVHHDGFNLIWKTIKESKKKDITIACVRALSELCKKNPERSSQLLDAYQGVSNLLDLMEPSNDDELITSIQYCVQCILDAYSGFDIKEAKKPELEVLQKYEKEIDLIMHSLVKRSASRVMSALGRDSLLELIMRNSDAEVLNWGLKLLDVGGLPYLLEVAGELEDIKHESSMNITSNTRSHVALVLERAYACMDHDKVREQFREAVVSYVDSLLKTPDMESKVRATNIITALLHGPIEIGNQILSQQGIVEMFLAMAGSEDETEQRVAAEALIAAASKKDKCTSIASMGAPVLKKLYQSPNDAIKVRALVGLCKLGSVGGADASVKPFSEGSMDKLVAACKKFLLNPKNRDLRKWATEGLAYLTLDAEIKEDIVADRAVVMAMVDLAKSGDLSCLYGVITTLVNLTNSYDKNEIMPEMLELAKFSKQHIPEEHVKDKKEFVDKRRKALAEMNITPALTALAKSESKSARELICRVFNALCEFQEHRGAIVQAGGAKILLNMALENNSPPGKLEAAQALARIGITNDPQVAFPGQRAAEVVRPLKELLRPDCTALQNFEALMALTNLATAGESVVKRILKDEGYLKVEHYMFEEHEHLRRAATQCVSNFITHPDVVKLFECQNDRVKLLVCMSEEDDLDTAKAASGALAMLTGVSDIACEKVFDTKRWFEILLMLTASKDKDLQHRGVAVVNNMMHSKKEVAEKIVETGIFEILMAICRPEVDDISEAVKKLARLSLAKAQELKLVKSNDGNEENDDEPD